MQHRLDGYQPDMQAGLAASRLEGASRRLKGFTFPDRRIGPTKIPLARIKTCTHHHASISQLLQVDVTTSQYIAEEISDQVVCNAAAADRLPLTLACRVSWAVISRRLLLNQTRTADLNATIRPHYEYWDVCSMSGTTRDRNCFIGKLASWEALVPHPWGL